MKNKNLEIFFGNIKQVLFKNPRKSQGTMVLGKNVRRYFGRAQDPIPLSTRETGHRIKIKTQS